jgi:hypothetical protein
VAQPAAARPEQMRMENRKVRIKSNQPWDRSDAKGWCQQVQSDRWICIHSCKGLIGTQECAAECSAGKDAFPEPDFSGARSMPMLLQAPVGSF